MDEVTTYYLEMRSPDELRAKTDSLGLEISECTVNQFEHSKSLYALVGGTWQWTGKQAWSDDDWRASRVWVHTCSLDHPSALKNYEARGMVVCRIDRGDQM